MKPPELDRMFETFIRIEHPSQPPPSAQLAESTRHYYLLGQVYLATLRQVVGPLVRSLVTAGLIDWYGFVIHNQESGVPWTLDNGYVYIHLRVSLADQATDDDLIAALPAVCLETRRMPREDSPSMDGINLSALTGSDRALAWEILGLSSGLALAIVDAHPSDQPIPVQHLRQFLHYSGNQLAASLFGLPAP